MWSGTVGLVNGQYKYLTAETFGHKINANGVGLKKKQQWTIEPFPTNGEQNGSSRLEDIDELENVCIRSHLNCYLAVDSFGNVTCESQERTEGARFTITICSMSQGMAQGLKSIILSITLSKSLLLLYLLIKYN
jgi:fascin 1/2